MTSQFWTASPLLVITVPSLQMSSVSRRHVLPLQRTVTDLGVTSWTSTFHKSLKKVSECVSALYLLFFFKCQFKFAVAIWKCSSYFIVKYKQIMFFALLKQYQQGQNLIFKTNITLKRIVPKIPNHFVFLMRNLTIPWLPICPCNQCANTFFWGNNSDKFTWSRNNFVNADPDSWWQTINHAVSVEKSKLLQTGGGHPGGVPGGAPVSPRNNNTHY